MRDQRDVLSEQIRQQNLLAPLMWKAIGITPQYDKDNKLIGFSQQEDPNQSLRDQIETGGLQRSLAALKGELPDNPALLRDLRDQEATLNESLRKQLGPGYQQSTAGQNATGEFMQRKDALLDASRRGDLSLGEALSITRQDSQNNNLNQMLSRIGAVGGQGYGQAAALGAAAGGYNQPLAQLFAAREGQFGARALNFQLDASNPFTGYNLGRRGLNLLDSAAGMGMAASSKHLKKDIRPMDEAEHGEALSKLRDTPVKRWRYTWESDEREPHMGPILEESPKEMRADDRHVSLIDYLGLQHAAIKDLDRRLTLRESVGRT